MQLRVLANQNQPGGVHRLRGGLGNRFARSSRLCTRDLERRRSEQRRIGFLEELRMQQAHRSLELLLRHYKADCQVRRIIRDQPGVDAL